MKTLFTTLLLLLFSFYPIINYAGRCTGSPYCTACKNCSSCKYCSEQGGSCGVCGSVESYEPPVIESQSIADNAPESKPKAVINNDYSGYEDYDQPKEEGSNWFWWIIGITGFIGLFIAFKK